MFTKTRTGNCTHRIYNHIANEELLKVISSHTTSHTLYKKFSYRRETARDEILTTAAQLYE